MNYRTMLSGLLPLLGTVAVAATAYRRIRRHRAATALEKARAREDLARFEDEGGPPAGPGPASA